MFTKMNKYYIIQQKHKIIKKIKEAERRND